MWLAPLCIIPKMVIMSHVVLYTHSGCKSSFHTMIMILPSARVLARNCVLSRTGRIAASDDVNKLFITSRCHWAENQQNSERSIVRQFNARTYSLKEGLALKNLMAIVREGKRKRDFRNFSVTSMAAPLPKPISPEEVEALRVIERESPRDMEFKNSGKSGVAVLRQEYQPQKAEKLSTSFYVDPPLLGFLVGKKAITKKNIERYTGVNLQIPSPKDAKDGKHVVLQGETQEALDNAMHQVHEVIDQAIKSPQFQYSHFVSIPLALHPKLLESVVDFQKSVLESGDSDMSDKGIDMSIFVKPTTFHLTLLMLKLWSEDRVQAAADCLQKTMPRVHEALEGSPLLIKLRGVDCMRGNPAQAHVLYADVEPDDQAARLIKASQVITEAFTEAGLVMDKDQTQTLKLHATLMNTTQRAGGGAGKRYKKRIPFDATDIMAKYEQYQWGQYCVSEAHLSQRFVYDKNGYYHCCSSIPFPEISRGVPIPE